MSARGRRRGFGGNNELLVAIAALGIILAIIIPVIAQLRDRAGISAWAATGMVVGFLLVALVVIPFLLALVTAGFKKLTRRTPEPYFETVKGDMGSLSGLMCWLLLLGPIVIALWRWLSD